MAEVVTRGHGEAERVARRAQVMTTFSVVAEHRADAVDELAVTTKAVDQRLDDLGLVVRSRDVNIGPSWRDGAQVGWQAEQHYRIRVDDLACLPELINAMIEIGPTSVNSPEWELVDDDDALAEAQRFAVADARRRARGYAEALGRRLGGLVSITDSGTAGERPIARSVGLGAVDGLEPAELNLDPQPVTVAVDCVATWALVD